MREEKGGKVLGAVAGAGVRDVLRLGAPAFQLGSLHSLNQLSTCLPVHMPTPGAGQAFGSHGSKVQEAYKTKSRTNAH